MITDIINKNSNHYCFGVIFIKGANYSSKREAIYNRIASTKSHPTARWIYDSLKDEYPDLSLGTVYRNLALFKEQGKVNCPAVVNGEERYDAMVDDHAHFVCEKCNHVYDVFDTNIKQIDDALLEQEFQVTRQNLVFYGICKNCK